MVKLTKTSSVTHFPLSGIRPGFLCIKATLWSDNNGTVDFASSGKASPDHICNSDAETSRAGDAGGLKAVLVKYVFGGLHVGGKPQTRRRLLQAACTMAIGLHWSSLVKGNDPAEPDLERQIKGSVNGLKTLADSEAEQNEENQILPEGFEILTPGETSRQLKQKARQLIPLMAMTPRNQQRVSDVLENISLYRRLPSIRFPCDHDCYDYFVDHPDSAVSIWRAMNLSAMNLWQTGPVEYECDSNDGTVGLLDYTYRAQGKAIAFSKGEFKSPFLKHTIEASGLMALHHEKTVSKTGQHLITHHADVFVRFPSRAIEATARLITPVSNMIADANFREISKFVYSMSIAMQQHPEWVEQVATRMDGILPQTRQQLLIVTATANQRNLEQLTALQTADISDAM